MKQTIPQLWQHYNYFHPDTRNKLPVVGMSACLLGENVRYDGQSKFFPQLNASVVPYVHVVSLCPEVAVGMGVPRPPIMLTLNNSLIEARGVADHSLNMTGKLSAFANQTHQQYNNLCGYIFKARSPSCGSNTTPLFDIHGNEISKTDGIYAAQLKKHMPWLPVCDEEDLLDQQYKESFLLLVYLVNDWRLTRAQMPELLGKFYAHHRKECLNVHRCAIALFRSLSELA